MILAFVDTETTGLDPFIHEPWELAIILRTDTEETEHVFAVEPDLTNATPKALEINRYHERTSAPGWRWNDPSDAAFHVFNLLTDAVVVGSNPGFDTAMIRNLIGRHHPIPGPNATPWHYRPIDIATLAAGFMWAHEPELMTKDPKPISSRWLSRQVGVEPPGEGVAHTALGDARWARDVYDAITRDPRRTGAASA